MMITTKTTVGWSLVLLMRLTTVQAWYVCSEETGGGICPDRDFCCASGIPGQSRCIPGTKNETFIQHPGVCCSNGGGACGQNYTCGTADDGSSSSCDLIPNTVDGDSPPTLPRYPMCSFPAATAQVASTLYGLTLIPSGKDEDTSSAPIMAYYSTHGDLQQEPSSSSSFSSIHTVVISIHGSERNADDYLCGTYAAVPDPVGTLVIAPWFVAPNDLQEGHPYLQWIDDVHPLAHVWRYGADSMQHNVSAFAVTDAFLDAIVAQIPTVQTIVVTGHSAGGQYTQRWALLSNHPLLSSSSSSNIQLRVVVANPKSWAYLDGRRWMEESPGGGSWCIPSQEELYHCPMYNDWTWGFENAVDDFLLPVPYKDAAIDLAGGIEALIQRYPSRFVVYFQGFLDVVPNGACPDLFQGANRRERSRRYYNFLQTVYNRTIHYRLEALKVHHDHSLMYASPEGQVALFGNTSQLKRMQFQQQRQQQNESEGETSDSSSFLPHKTANGALDAQYFGATNGDGATQQQQRPMLRRFFANELN